MDEDFVFRYSIEDAENDGVLFKIYLVNPDWEKGIFSHVTTNLLSYGYEESNIIKLPNLLDLLNQCATLVHEQSDNYKNYSSKFSGKIEFPNGEKKIVWICENELGKFTIMLPEDY